MDNSCQQGQCLLPGECLPGSVLCGDQCVDVSVDPANCGGCGQGCNPGDSCIFGNCVQGCAVGATLCGIECVTLDSDAGNCGGCGTACAANEVCAGGMCGAMCPKGTVQCGQDCANAATDPNCVGSD